MRSSVVAATRVALVAVLAAGLVPLPSMAAASKPLGLVVAADHAYLDHANAATGASVYSDDALVTDQGGSLRLSVGPSQIYLLSLSSASLEPRDDKIQARVDRGTLGFSTARPAQLEIQTPLGVVHGADANPIFGQVSLVNPSTLRVSSYEGTLVVQDVNGGHKIIAQGETYEGTLVSDASGGDNNPPKKGVTGVIVNWSHVLKVGIPTIVAAVAIACWLYPESPSSMGCWN
ncbi:MAG TPA: hypothetical protein VGR97_00605 [Candidatus Acidoferrales bacterium]|nr:hypothetical protein [Candidatus Acidoferrales bacterium]